jgi:acetyl-CoA carboxylase, biotin carboxylase subunit
MAPIRRLFIANRGEIAVRIVRACQKLGLQSVVAVSDADRDTLAARLATSAVCIGPAPAAQSYLKPETLVTAALGTGCQALHPGYGFLSERAEFARLCGQAGIAFVGPSPEAIAAMGDKIAAVKLAEQARVPRVPGSGEIEDLSAARREADRIGYPVLLKARTGGGGRGMRLVRTERELAGAVEAAASEAKAAFGDAALYMEKFITRARHIEIQVLGDGLGNVVHLGERDCSTQRRHQKLIEEAPAPAIDDAVRKRLAEAGIALARQVNYRSAGTVEFVYDEHTRDAYFLEMNTRIQVEHPVTEMVAGYDLVAEQIRIAAGEPISFRQEDVRTRGHAIECRINAENAARNFMPSPGRLDSWRTPAGDGIRVDTHCYAGYRIPPFYDSLLAKVIVHGPDRAIAIAMMVDALTRFEVSGLATTIPFHLAVLRHEDFRCGRVHTRWVDEDFPGLAPTPRARTVHPASTPT